MILLVEDNAVNRLAFSETLRAQGHEVLEAGDGAEALLLVTKHRDAIALVITDMVLPKMNGITLIQNIRLLIPKVPIIMVSAYMSKAGAESILNRQAEFLEKPILPDALVSVVHRFLPANR